MCAELLALQFKLVEYELRKEIGFDLKLNEFYFSKMDQNSSSIDLLKVGIYLAWSFGTTLLCCELGEMLNSKFEQFSVALCQCKWYLFPIEMRHMLLIVITNAQQPTVLCGFGNIYCTREFLKKVK